MVGGGYVRTIVPRGDVTYIGGTFDELAAVTGAFARLDAASGRRNALLAEAHGGEVRASVADGNGGFYIGGTFTTLGGETRRGIGHILADGSVDRSFGPGISGTNSVVNALALSGDGRTLYVGGSFVSIGGQLRNNLAAVEAATGRVTVFNPAGLGTDGPVHALEVSGTQVYVGGEFRTLGGQTRNGLAKVAGTTGGDLGWTPTPTLDGGGGAVLAIEAAGGFGLRRRLLHRHRRPAARDIAKLSATSGQAVAGFARMLAAASSTRSCSRARSLYAGGDFNIIGGQTRTAVARLNATTGNATAFNYDALRLRRPRPGDLRHEPLCRRLPAPRRHPDREERDPGQGQRHHRGQDPGVQPRHRGLRHQTYGPHAGGRRHEHLRGRRHLVREPGHAARDRGARRGRDSDRFQSGCRAGPANSNDVYAIAVRGNDIYLGGDFTSMGGQPRNLIAKVSTDGTLDPNFNPNPTGGDFAAIRAIVVTSTDVYVGGDFSSIGGQPRLDLAKLNPITGQVDGGRQAFDPDPTIPTASEAISVGRLQVSGDDVYVAGGFTTIGGLSRSKIAKISATTGDADAQFDANISDRILPEVVDLVLARGTLFVAGVFSSIGGAARNNVAALNPRTGYEVTGFNPDVTRSRPVVYDIEVTDDEVYIGGGFDQVGGDGAGEYRPPHEDRGADRLRPEVQRPARCCARARHVELDPLRRRLFPGDGRTPADRVRAVHGGPGAGRARHDRRRRPDQRGAAARRRAGSGTLRGRMGGRRRGCGRARLQRLRRRGRRAVHALADQHHGDARRCSTARTAAPTSSTASRAISRATSRSRSRWRRPRPRCCCAPTTAMATACRTARTAARSRSQPDGRDRRASTPASPTSSPTPAGCTLMDRISEAASGALNLRQFVRRVDRADADLAARRADR